MELEIEWEEDKGRLVELLHLELAEVHHITEDDLEMRVSDFILKNKSVESYMFSYTAKCGFILLFSFLYKRTRLQPKLRRQETFTVVQLRSTGCQPAVPRQSATHSYRRRTAGNICRVRYGYGLESA